MTNVLHICATPIGNISDITIRAIEVLKQADYIACEDTRVTRLLSDKYGFSAQLFDCHKFNEKERSTKIIELIKKGYKVVLVSDAGTPLISDPGSVLLSELLKNDIKVTSLPGACAVTTFLSMLPRSNEEFAFIGFIPRTFNNQLEILNKYKNTNCVFYESAQRLIKTLENIQSIYGIDTKISIGRELTKMFEEVKTGSIAEIIEYYKNNTLKGEIVAMVYAVENQFNDDSELKQRIDILKNAGYSTKDVSKILSLLYKENKNKIYKLAEIK